MTDNASGWNRRFLVGGAASLALASFYLAAVARGALKGCNDENVDSMLSPDLRSIIRIGNCYLNECTENGELDSHDDLIFSETETSLANVTDAVQRHLVAINRQALEEFARCETVLCDGWVLAKSEARFCAMIAACARRL